MNNSNNNNDHFSDITINSINKMSEHAIRCNIRSPEKSLSFIKINFVFLIDHLYR